MSERRKFIRGLGLFGAVVSGAAAAKFEIKQNENVEDISRFAPENSQSTLTLQGGKRINEPTPNSLGFVFSNVEYENQLHMSVGKDNRLWIQVGNDWRRVSID